MNADLELCDINHLMVCFSRSESCPVCELKRERSEQDEEISRLLKVVEDLKGEITDLKRATES